ncbi:unnamed protein product [Scytosiphon promiscuus]
MRVRRALYGLATVAACLLPTASGDAPPHVEGGEEGLGGVEREMEAAINQQLMLAERCSISEHARACREDSVMLFAETMFGGCSPVGCFDLEAAKEGAIVHEGDHGAAVRTAIVQQRAAWLADEEAEVSVGQHLLSLAVEFHEDEARSKTMMRQLLKKRRAKRDLPAIRQALEDAISKGYAHAFIAKASDIVQWASSPAAVVLSDQVSASTLDGRCTKSATACGSGSTAIVARRGRGRSCGVAGCIDVSAEDLEEARVAAAAGDAGQEKLARWAEAVAKQFPFLTDEADLVGFNKRLAVVAEGREEERRLLNEIIQIIIREGYARDGPHDYGALRFFLELAQHEGFVGNDVDEARLLLASHNTSIMIRRAVDHAVSRATASLVAVQRQAKARSAKILRQEGSIAKLEGDNAHLRKVVEQTRYEIAASVQRGETLFRSLAARDSQLEKQKSERQAEHDIAATEARLMQDEISTLRATAGDLEAQLTTSMDGERSAQETVVSIQAKLADERRAWKEESRRLQAEKIAKEAAFASELEAKNIAASIREREQRDEIAALGTIVATLETRLTSSQDEAQAARGLITAIKVDLAIERAAREEASNQLQSVSDYAQSLAGDLADCHTLSMALERDAIDERAAAASRQQRCIGEVASLVSSLNAQGASQAQVESLLALSEGEIAGLRLDMRERAIAAEGNAQQLRSALEREKKLSTSVTLLEEEVIEAAVELSDCRTRVESLVDKGSACEAEREARAREVVALRDTFGKERDRAAAAQSLADSWEKTAESKAKAVVDHEVMANSLKTKLGSTTAKAEVAERKAKALEEEVAEAKQENETVQDELDLCWKHFGDLNHVTSDFLSFMADKVHAAGGHVELSPKPELGRALGTHEAYKSMRAQLYRVRLAVGSFADGVKEEQERLREHCGPCDCVDGTTASDDVEGDGEDAQGGVTSTTV